MRRLNVVVLSRLVDASRSLPECTLVSGTSDGARIAEPCLAPISDSAGLSSSSSESSIFGITGAIPVGLLADEFCSSESEQKTDRSESVPTPTAIPLSLSPF